MLLGRFCVEGEVYAVYLPNYRFAERCYGIIQLESHVSHEFLLVLNLLCNCLVLLQGEYVDIGLIGGIGFAFQW